MLAYNICVKQRCNDSSFQPLLVHPCLQVSPQIKNKQAKLNTPLINDQNKTKIYDYFCFVSRCFWVISIQELDYVGWGATVRRYKWSCSVTVLHWDSPSSCHQTFSVQLDTWSHETDEIFCRGVAHVSELCEYIVDGKRIRALLLWIPSEGLQTFDVSHFSICLTMYMIWAKRMFRKD